MNSYPEPEGADEPDRYSSAQSPTIIPSFWNQGFEGQGPVIRDVNMRRDTKVEDYDATPAMASAGMQKRGPYRRDASHSTARIRSFWDDLKTEAPTAGDARNLLANGRKKSFDEEYTWEESQSQVFMDSGARRNTRIRPYDSMPNHLPLRMHGHGIDWKPTTNSRLSFRRNQKYAGVSAPAGPAAGGAGEPLPRYRPKAIYKNEGVEAQDPVNKNVDARRNTRLPTQYVVADTVSDRSESPSASQTAAERSLLEADQARLRADILGLDRRVRCFVSEPVRRGRHRNEKNDGLGDPLVSDDEWITDDQESGEEKEEVVVQRTEAEAVEMEPFEEHWTPFNEHSRSTDWRSSRLARPQREGTFRMGWSGVSGDEEILSYLEDRRGAEEEERKKKKKKGIRYVTPTAVDEGVAEPRRELAFHKLGVAGDAAGVTVGEGKGASSELLDLLATYTTLTVDEIAGVDGKERAGRTETQTQWF